jgi:FAD/FMN-containing dehydrogenase
MQMKLSTHELQGQVSGSLWTPDDPAYEQTRRGWNLNINHHPALILAANNTQDIAAGVRFARQNGLAIAVQSTGHGIHTPADDSLLILTSRMSGVQVDVAAHTARVEAGVIWQQVLDAATPHGLAPLVGTSPHVGVVGYSLGGGIGWMARRYGLAADSVRWVELVTADGVLRRASPTENNDLFWGLRGGGGSFGVVTALEIDLYPVATVYGGYMTYPAPLISEALRFYRDWVKIAPDEITSSIAIIKAPNLPQIPEAMRGQKLFIFRAVFVGDEAAGAATIQPWLDWQTPTGSTFRQMPFADIGTVANDPVDPQATHYSNEMLDELSDEAMEIIVRRATDSASPLMVSELRHAGGAISGAHAHPSATGNREAQFYLQMAGQTPTPEMRAAADAYIQDYKRELRPYLRGGVYLNFLRGAEAHARVRDAYSPESYQRLVALKAKYDPDNMFRFGYPLVEAEPAK